MRDENKEEEELVSFQKKGANDKRGEYKREEEESPPLQPLSLKNKHEETLTTKHMRENKDGSWYNLPKTISKHTIFLKQFENILGKLYVENHDPRLSS